MTGRHRDVCVKEHKQAALLENNVRRPETTTLAAELWNRWSVIVLRRLFYRGRQCIELPPGKLQPFFCPDEFGGENR